jgi:hypothetical protein
VGRPRLLALAIAAALLLIAAAFAPRLTSYLGSRSPSQPASAAASAPEPAPVPVDLVDAASAALQDCPRATAPAVPDGASASRTEMAAARTAFQSFDAATNSYVRCVDTTIESIGKQYGAVASQDQLRSLKAFGVGAHDTAIDQEQAIADRLNTEVRAYNAKHPHS